MSAVLLQPLLRPVVLRDNHAATSPGVFTSECSLLTMKTSLRSLLASTVLLLSLPLHAALVVPGADGSDGPLLITANTEIDLSNAVDGAWDTNNSANAGKGVYDASKWAVVFKYSSVTINAGATLKFKNHRSRAPVVWLVSGNVTIEGTVSLDGQIGADFPRLAEPGPGGFRGGMIFSGGVGFGSGFGPGGGQRGNWATGGSYGTLGLKNNTNFPAPPTYGNPSLVPLIGGSGGGAHPDRDNNWPNGGGAGGGALLIASTGTISVMGELRANGGYGRTGSGSGGGIRLVASAVSGTGKVNALGGTINDWNAGGLGRIRIERVTTTSSFAVMPSPSIIQLADNSTALIWPPTSAPKVEVVSIGGSAAPADPSASFDNFPADFVVADVTTTPVVIKTTNVEQASQVKVRVTPRTNGNYTEVDAAVSQVVSTNPLVINWTANLPVSTGASSVIVRVVRP